jgi:hypothetical protein
MGLVPAAQAQESSLTILAPSSPATVATVPSSAGRAGTLALTVETTAPGALSLQFVATRTGNTSVVNANGPGLRITVPSDQLTPVTGQPAVLTVTFTLAPGEPIDDLSGSLLVRNGDGTNQVLAIQGSLGDTGPPTPQPAKATLAVTSWWPVMIHGGSLFHNSTSIELPATPLEPGGWSQSSILQSDGGSKLRATLTSESGQGHLSADRIGGVGPYAGTVVFGAAANDSLPVTIHVRDFFLWPFLVLVVGSLIGGYFLRWLAQQRRDKLLIERASVALKGYKDAAAGRGEDDVPKPLPDDQDAAYAALVKAIGAVQGDDDAYNAQVDAVAAFELRLKTWVRLAAAAAYLTGNPAPGDSPGVTADVQQILNRVRGADLTDDELGPIADDADRMVEIVKTFQHAWAVWDAHQATGPSPDSVYVTGSYGSVTAMQATRAKLEALAGGLELTSSEAGLTLYRELVTLPWVGPAQRAQVTVADVAIGPLTGFSEKTPAQMQRNIRTWDWLTATIAALITLLAFLLTKYNHDFGSLQDYAQVFAAGFLGQVAGAAVVWTLFPTFQSYTAGKAKTAAS